MNLTPEEVKLFDDNFSGKGLSIALDLVAKNADLRNEIASLNERINELANKLELEIATTEALKAQNLSLTNEKFFLKKRPEKLLEGNSNTQPLQLNYIITCPGKEATSIKERIKQICQGISKLEVIENKSMVTIPQDDEISDNEIYKMFPNDSNNSLEEPEKTSFKEVKKLRDRVAQLEGELHSLNSLSKKTEITLRDRIAELEKENLTKTTSPTSKALNLAFEENEKLRDRIAQLEEDIARREETIAELESENDTWRERDESAEERIEKLVDTVQNQATRLDRETHDLRHKLTQSQEEREQLSILIKNAARILTQAIGDELVHAEKNKAICKAIYPLIEQISLSDSSYKYKDSEYSEF